MTHADRLDQLAIITSEPLTDDTMDWVPVPENHTLLITKNTHIILAPTGSDEASEVAKTLIHLRGLYYGPVW
jgi:hypothetical protein